MKAALLSLFVGCAAFAQDKCPDFSDAGTPEPPPLMKIAPGTVVDQPLWVATPARICKIDQEKRQCEEDMKAAKAPTWVYIVGAIVSTAATGLTTYETGRAAGWWK